MLNTYLWIVTAVYLLVLVYIGFLSKKVAVKSFKDYAIASKSFPNWVLFLTFFSTMWGMTNFVGHGDKTANLGLSWLPFIWGEQFGKVIFALTLGGIIGKYSYNTVSDFIDDLVVKDKHTKAIVGILLSTLGIAWTGAQCLAVGQLFNALTGADIVIVTMITGVVVIAYTAMGGIVSVVWTDIVQGGIMIFAGIVYYIFAFARVDFSIAELATRVKAIDPNLWSFKGVSFVGMISLFLTSCMAQFVYQTAWQRFFAAKNAKGVKNVYMWIGIISIIGLTITAMTGLIALTEGVPGETGLTITMIKTSAPMWMILTLFILIGGATLSTADSFLNSGAINIVNDVVKTYKPELNDNQLVNITTWVTVVMGIVSMLGSLKFKYIVDYAAVGYTICGATVFPLLAIGLLWKKDKSKEYSYSNSNITPLAARIALICGSVISTAFQLNPALKKVMEGGIIPGAIATSLLLIIVSLVTKDVKHSNIVDV